MSGTSSAGISISKPRASADTERSLAWPLADQSLAQPLLDLVQQASHYRQLRKGANEGEPFTSPFT